MGPPRVIGGYWRWRWRSPRALACFNGAAESNRRIPQALRLAGQEGPQASMGPPRVIGGYA